VQPSDAASWRSRRFWRVTCADGSLDVQKMGRGYAWLDTGTHASLLDAGNFVRTLTERQGMQTGCPEEIAYSKGWITAQLSERISLFTKNAYGDYLKSLL
jgi:glucose-1-phosphate thymidylyltransferase